MHSQNSFRLEGEGEASVISKVYFEYDQISNEKKEDQPSEIISS